MLAFCPPARRKGNLVQEPKESVFISSHLLRPGERLLHGPPDPESSSIKYTEIKYISITGEIVGKWS